MRCVLTATIASLGAIAPASGADAPQTPNIVGFRVAPLGPVLDFDPFPSTSEYQFLRADDPAGPFAPVTGTVSTDFSWQGPVVQGDQGFYRLGAKTLSPDQLAAANLLSRVGYGPSPDETDLVGQLGIGPYLDRQINAEGIDEDLDVAPPFVGSWQKVTATGPGSASLIYIYLDGQGDVYVDDMRLVAGATDNGSQPNLLKNGGFESALGTDWIASPNLAGSALTTAEVKAGAASLHVVSSEAGSTKDSSIYQTITPALSSAKTYTLTYWYHTTDNSTHLTVRLSGSGIVTTESASGMLPHPGRLAPKLAAAQSYLADLRAWHLLRALQSKRQLNEVLRQFLENHFVTQYSKSNDYLDNIGYTSNLSQQIATQMEFLENRRWATALLDPAVTFHDLLQISATSPAMILYLDTVNSHGEKKGDGTYNVANENYARELSELFCFGVDNGYDQGDIVQLSRAWTGWSTDLLAPGKENNPFATRSTVYLDPNAVTNKTALTNRVGTWSLRYIASHHDPRPKYIFHQKDAAGLPIAGSPKVVPARFGQPWAGRPYGLAITSSGNGTNTISEGNRVLAHMADQPFTEEFIVVKLCRLFIHDDFQTGYDFTDADTSPEEDLVKAAMLAWENPPGGGPKGQLRPVLRVILGSDLFRSTLSTQQKVKTPLEFAVSAIRALRTPKGDGTFTSDTDGYSLQPVMSRAGLMLLFNRAEPNGYPETGPSWISAGTLAERLRFAQAALMAPGDRPGGELDATTFTDPVALLRVRQPSAISNAGAAADYFLGLLFHTEGEANLAGLRALAVRYLDTADDGVTASLYSSLSPGTKAHDTRVRGLVSFLLCSQRFQEQ